MSARVEFAASRLRYLAQHGLTSEELLEHVVSCLGNELTPFAFIATLREAFGISVFVLRDQVECWVGLGLPGCDTPTSDVVSALDPFVTAFRERLSE
jgi:hypothetical protein